MRGGVLFLCLLGIFLSGAGVVSAEMIGNYTIDGMHISPMYEEVIPIDDGKEIVWIEEGNFFEVWKQRSVAGILSYLDGTIFRDILFVLIPVISVMTGLFCIFKWTERKRVRTLVPENILSYLNDHPGATQQQIIDAMETSRGSGLLSSACS